MQGGDAVGPLGEAQAHHRHVEEAGVPSGVGLRAEAQDPVDVDAGQFAVVAEVPGDELALEPVYPGGHRGVRREDRPGPHRLQGGVEVEARLGELADAFQAEEPGVSLVGVEDLGGGVPGEPAVGPHGTHPADAQQHLLEQAVIASAAVEPVGDVAFAGGVLLDVGVEQQQRDTADLGLPDGGVQRASAGQGQHHPAGGAVRLAQEGERQLVGVEDGVVLLLPAVPGQGLAEVAVAVEQADPDERHTEVAGGLEVVAGEDAEAAGVLGQGGGDSEFG